MAHHTCGSKRTALAAYLLLYKVVLSHSPSQASVAQCVLIFSLFPFSTITQYTMKSPANCHVPVVIRVVWIIATLNLLQEADKLGLIHLQQLHGATLLEQVEHQHG